MADQQSNRFDIPKTVKSWVLGGPDELKQVEKPVPEPGKAKVLVRYVPYGRGRAPAEFLGGRIDATLQWPSRFNSHADAGKLNILAVTSASRIPLLPNVPTAKEQGVDIDITMWRGIAVSKGTPKDRIATLEKAIKAVVASPEFVAASKKMGFEPAFLGASDFDSLIKSGDQSLSNLMDELGLKKNKM